MQTGVCHKQRFPVSIILLYIKLDSLWNTISSMDILKHTDQNSYASLGEETLCNLHNFFAFHGTIGMEDM